MLDLLVDSSEAGICEVCVSDVQIEQNLTAPGNNLQCVILQERGSNFNGRTGALEKEFIKLLTCQLTRSACTIQQACLQGQTDSGPAQIYCHVA